MTRERCGSCLWINAARNGWAEAVIPENDNSPPASSRRTSVCPAGIRNQSANNVPVAEAELEGNDKQAILAAKPPEFKLICRLHLTRLQAFANIFTMAAIHPLLILPFAMLLGAMAFGPVFAPNWWARHYAKVALGLGGVVAVVFLFVQ